LSAHLTREGYSVCTITRIVFLSLACLCRGSPLHFCASEPKSALALCACVIVMVSVSCAFMLFMRVCTVRLLSDTTHFFAGLTREQFRLTLIPRVSNPSLGCSGFATRNLTGSDAHHFHVLCFQNTCTLTCALECPSTFKKHQA
jgi:hypothetical protein